MSTHAWVENPDEPGWYWIWGHDDPGLEIGYFPLGVAYMAGDRKWLAMRIEPPTKPAPPIEDGWYWTKTLGCPSDWLPRLHRNGFICSLPASSFQIGPRLPDPPGNAP